MIQLDTLEQKSPTATTLRDLYIGIPAELNTDERRVALTPQAVKMLTAAGSQILVQTQAGVQASFSDEAYSQAGAQIVHSSEDLYKANIILKIAPPTIAELNLMSRGQIVLSVLNLPNIKPEFLEKLLQKEVIAIAYEYLKDLSGSLPIVRSMSEIAGSMAMLIASENLNQQGKLLGNITGLPPSKVVVLGAGTVGEYATRIALGLGAEVRVFDNFLYKLRRLQNAIGQRVFTSVLQPEIVASELARADIAIGAIYSHTGQTPQIVSQELVRNMKPNAFIVDVSIDQGGCFETSRPTTPNDPTFSIHGITHFCVPNIPSRVPNTASIAISNILAPLLMAASDKGGIENYIFQAKNVLSGVYAYKGHLTNAYLCTKFGYKYTNLDMIAAARM